MTRKRSQGASRHAGSRLLVVSNRLPVALRRAAARRWDACAGSGGLVTALLPVLRQRGGMWFGWPGAAGPVRPMLAAISAAGKAAGCKLAPISLSDAEVRGFYHGFSNEVVWPLFHDMPSL